MRQQRFFILWVMVITAVFLASILTDTLPWLRGPDPDSPIWHWPYLLRPFSRWWVAIGAGTFFLGVLAGWLRQKDSQRWQTSVALSLLFASSLALQWGLLYADRANPMAELVDRTLAVQTNGYFWTAANITDINQTLANYPTAMTQFESDHARTHPPGLVVSNWITKQLLQRSPELASGMAQTIQPLRCTDLWLLEQPRATVAALGIWAILPLILGATAVFPAYLLTKSISNNGLSAKLSGLVAAIPALLIFAPLPDQIYTLLTLLIFAAYRKGWQIQNGRWLFLAGLLLSISTFLSVGNGAILIFLGCYSLLMLWQRPYTFQQLGRLLVPFALGLIVIWGVYWLGWGVPPWAIVVVGLDEHFSLVIAQRNYTTWLGFNLLDLALFTGLPIFIAFICALGTAMRSFIRKEIQEKDVLILSTASLILILTLSGSTRGEVGRIWLFFMPLMLIASVIWLADWLPNKKWLWGLASMQIIWAIGLGLSWQPIQATIVTAQKPAFAMMPTNSSPVNVHFDHGIILSQTALNQSSTELTLTLNWEASQPTERPYAVFNHLIDEQGNLISQADGWSINGQWPTTCWQDGEPVIDQHHIPLPPNLPAGNYTIHTGLYNNADGTRLITNSGEGHTISGQITIAP